MYGIRIQYTPRYVTEMNTNNYLHAIHAKAYTKTHYQTDLVKSKVIHIQYLVYVQVNKCKYANYLHAITVEEHDGNWLAEKLVLFAKEYAVEDGTNASDVVAGTL